MPPATLAATTRGIRDRIESSNNSSSIASSTDASGAPKVAAIPAAAPEASKIFRSEGVTLIIWPTSEPIAPPVTMIGPSAPNGAPVPMAIAAESGLGQPGAGPDPALTSQHRLHRFGDAVTPDERLPPCDGGDDQRPDDGRDHDAG